MNVSVNPITDTLVAEELMRAPNIISSNSRDRGNLDSDLAYVSHLDAQGLAREMETRLLAELYDFEQVQFPYFQPLNEQFQENVDYFNSFQYSDEDKAAIIAQGLKPYTVNIFKRFGLTFLGEAMARRTMWRAKGLGQESRAKEEFANRILRHVFEENNWQMGEYYIIRDGMIGNRGVCSVGLDPMNPLGAIKLERHRPQEFMWHVGTAKDPRLSGIRYLERIYMESRARMIVEFPEWAEELKRGMFGDIRSRWGHKIDNFVQPKVTGTMASLGYNSRFDPYVEGAWAWRDWIVKREFYKVEKELRYRVADGYMKTFYDFELKQQAEAFAYELNEYYKAKLARNRTPVNAIAVSAPMPAYVDVIYQTIWAGDNLLRVEKTGHNKFPYFFFIPEWYDGDITSFFQHGKDQQRLLNRQVTYMDEAAGAAKGKIVINRGALEDDQTPEEVTENLQSISAPLFINVPTGRTIKEMVDRIPAPDMGQIPTLMYKLMTEAQLMMFGGENSIGLQETSQESGKAVAARRAAASLATIPHFEEFSVFKKSVGEEVLFRAQSLNPVVQMMIVNGTQDPEAQEIIFDGEQGIADLRFAIQVAEVEASPTEKDARLSRLMVLASQAPDLAPHIMKTALKYSDVDKSDIDEIMASVQEQMNIDRQMALTEQAAKEDKERRALEIQYLRELIRLRELEIKEENPAKIGLNFMFKEPNPSLTAEILKREGIDADPMGVAAGESIKSILEEEKLQREHERDMEIERLRAASKPKRE